MKVTVLEYEEDPSIPKGKNSTDDDEDEADSSSSREQQQPVCEYTLQVEEVVSNNSNGSNSKVIMSNNRRVTKMTKKKMIPTGDIFRSPVKVLRKLFLPLGYPHSVGSTYLPYQMYDGLQGLCSYWRGVVSAKAVFEAAGVGNAEATALSAALSWALRDGTGMIGGLVYSYFAGSYFDSHAKEFRLLLADVINDVALTLDMVAPYFGQDWSIWILGLSTIGKTICGITAGATKGHITQHFAKDGGNVADLTAKESTQETLVSLLGMIGGVWVAKLLDRHGQNNPFFWTWLLFGILTAIHVFANYKAVSLLKLRTLNPERTRQLFRQSIVIMANQARQQKKTAVTATMTSKNQNSKNDRDDHSKATSISPELLESIHDFDSPESIQESLLSSIWHLVFPSIRVSRPLDWNRLQNCTLYLSDFEERDSLPYVIGYGINSAIYVWLKAGATMRDELQAYVHALLIQMLLSGDARGGFESEKVKFNASLLRRTYIEVNNLFNSTSVDKVTTNIRVGVGTPSQKLTIPLIERLDILGWDLRSRLYLGFSSRRLKTFIKED